MAESPLLGLPPELRTLVDFLESDNRPSIVYETANTPEGQHPQPKKVYSNPAFRKRINVSEQLDISLTVAAGKSKGHRALVTDGMRWNFHPLRSSWTVAVCEEVQEKFGRPAIDLQSRKDDDTLDAERKKATITEIDGNIDSAALIDWTRFAVPDISPWTQHVRDFDWAATAVGPMKDWPPELRQSVVSIMANPDPRLVIWGDDQTFVYNEACIPLFGNKHPGSLGKPARVVWERIWDHIGKLFDAAHGGKATKVEKMPLTMERAGFMEETFWDFTLLPIVGHDGRGFGVLDELSESTQAVTGERKRSSVLEVGEYIADASSLSELWSRFLQGLESAKEDIPYALLYSIVDDQPDAVSDSAYSSTSGNGSTRKKCILERTLGLQQEQLGEDQTSFALIDDLETGTGLVKPCLHAWKSRESTMLCKRDDSLPQSLNVAVTGRGFGDVIKTATAMPITSITGSEVVAILILGLNPRTPFDEEYSLYTRVLADILLKAVALISLPQEQRRAQKIAEDINSALAQQLRMTTLQAERSEAKFSRLAGAAPTGMFLFDIEGRPLYVNDAYCEMMGESRENVFSQNRDKSSWHNNLHPEDKSKFWDAWDRLINQKTPINIEYRLKQPWKSVDRASGNELTGDSWMLATAFPEVEPDGRVSTVQGWLTDISYQKFSENLLSQRLEDALETKRQSENFIDMTSHEMRNPLSAILQSADSIVSTLEPNMPIMDEDMKISHVVAEELIDAAQTIILCAQHQKRIVDDILTLSKLDASLLVISPDKVRPPQLIDKALKMYESEVHRAAIDVRVCMEPTYDELKVDWVMLDPSRILQVVINLLTNAIKFTQYSETRNITICVGASYEKPTGKHHNVSFVPTRNARATQTPQSPDWGSGEDLYLQFAVIDTGRGLSPEEMQLLFQRFSQASPKTYKQYGGSGLGLFISRELCELQGGQIGVNSGNGKTTFTFFVRAKRWVPESPHLSKRPSYQRYVSTSSSPMAFSRRGSTVLNGATAKLQKEQAKSGADEKKKQEEKPAKKENKPLKHANTWPEKIKEEGDVHANGQENVELHVLIVEDNLINQKVMSQQLRRAGCVVHVANHGLECLDFLEKSSFCSEKTPLSVILLDLEMPTMDGLTCIRHIRERQQEGKVVGHVPVIAVTANARSEQISIAIDAGMDQVVTKPFRIPELVPQMHSLVAELSARNSP